MKRAYVCVALLGVVLGIVGCGDDEEGGSCTTTEPVAQCYQVTDPADYDVKSECGAVGGTWSKDLCNPANYARKCTDNSTEVDDKPVTYVYFFPEGSTEDCFGVEEPL